MRDEFSEQKAICQYVKQQYPSVVFFSDLSGIRLPAGLANKIKDLKCARGIPDLFILEPKKGYFGLAIEMKTTGVTVYRKDGALKADEHLREQESMLIKLTEKGYFAIFAEGFDNTKLMIDSYLS